jgi:hypothetical protein
LYSPSVARAQAGALFTLRVKIAVGLSGKLLHNAGSDCFDEGPELRVEVLGGDRHRGSLVAEDGKHVDQRRVVAGSKWHVYDVSGVTSCKLLKWMHRRVTVTSC